MKIFIISFIILAGLYLLFITNYHIILGESMAPTYHNNTYVLLDKFSYRLSPLKRGDVIVFHSKRNSVDQTSRIVGLPQERVALTGGILTINGSKPEEPYLSSNNLISPGEFLQEGWSLPIPSESYFVLNDNREKINDSREWGLVTKDSIVGKVLSCIAFCAGKN